MRIANTPSVHIKQSPQKSLNNTAFTDGNRKSHKKKQIKLSVYTNCASYGAAKIYSLQSIPKVRNVFNSEQRYIPVCVISICTYCIHIQISDWSFTSRAGTPGVSKYNATFKPRTETQHANPIHLLG